MTAKLSIVALLFTIADAYLAFCVMSETSWLVKALLFVPAIVYWALILKMRFTRDTPQSVLNWTMWLTLCIVVPTFVYTLFSVVGQGLGLLWQPLSPVLSHIGLAIAAVWFVIALYGSVFGWRRLEVKHTDISVAGLPSRFDGYRIAQLTDFHIGVYGATPHAVEKIVEKVNSLHPDLIVFTGDLVNTTPDELTQFTSVLSRLAATDGIVSVLGNHDYGFYHRYRGDDSPSKALKRVVEAQAAMGWRLLRNEAVQICRDGERIAVVGVENSGERHFPDYADLTKAMAGLPADECKILLSHDPSHWRREVLPDTDIPLMLAGHTHAMQFRLGDYSPSKTLHPEWGGLYTHADRALYISTGIGGNIAFRFGVYPTIDLLTLRPLTR